MTRDSEAKKIKIDVKLEKESLDVSSGEDYSGSPTGSPRSGDSKSNGGHVRAQEHRRSEDEKVSV